MNSGCGVDPLNTRVPKQRKRRSREPRGDSERDGDAECSARAGRRLDSQLAAEARDSHAEVLQALSPPTNPAWVEADAIVLDLQASLAVFGLEPETAMLRSRVARDVGKCLPNDLDHLPRIVGQPLGRLDLHLHSRWQPRAPLEVACQHQQGLVQAMVAQDAGTPPEGAVAEVLDGAVDGV